MKFWFKKNLKTIVTLSFIIPIVIVAIVSISHVTQWYTLTNPMTWAVYLSIGIEMAALSALSAISVKMGKKVYFPFIVVTLIQLIGNIYFSYMFIDLNSVGFKSWVELTSPLMEFMGVEPSDLVSHKRILSFFSGGMLPMISLSFLHMLVKFSEENNDTLDKKSTKKLDTVYNYKSKTPRPFISGGGDYKMETKDETSIQINNDEVEEKIDKVIEEEINTDPPLPQIDEIKPRIDKENTQRKYSKYTYGNQKRK